MKNWLSYEEGPRQLHWGSKLKVALHIFPTPHLLLPPSPLYE